MPEEFGMKNSTNMRVHLLAEDPGQTFANQLLDMGDAKLRFLLQ